MPNHGRPPTGGREKEGEAMSLEAMEQVTKVEEALRQRKSEAAAQAKQLVAQAEREGKQALESIRAQVEAQAKEQMAQAEERANRRAVQLQEESQEACAALRAAARERLDQAARVIVRRVVN